MHNFKSKGFGVKQREPCTRAAKNMYGLWVSWHWHEFLYLYETVYISRDGPYLSGILEGKQVHDAIMKLMPIWPGHIDWTNMNEPTNWHGFWGHGKPKHPKSSKYPSARGKIKGVFHKWKQRNFRFFMVKHIVKFFSFSLHLVETSHFKNWECEKRNMEGTPLWDSEHFIKKWQMMFFVNFSKTNAWRYLEFGVYVFTRP